MSNDQPFTFNFRNKVPIRFNTDITHQEIPPFKILSTFTSNLITFKKHYIVPITKYQHRKPFNEKEGQNMLLLYHKIQSSDEPTQESRSLTNFFGLLRVNKTDPEYFFSESTQLMPFMCIFVAIYKLLILAVVVHTLLYELPDYFPNTLSLLMNLMFLSKAVVCSVFLYDLTMSGTALMGHQSYKERNRLSFIQKCTKFDGKLGLFGLRASGLLILLVSGYYDKSGRRSQDIDYVRMLAYPVEYWLGDEKKDVLEFIMDSRLMIYYILYLSILTFMAVFINHPWVKPVEELSSKKAVKGVLGKISSLVLSVNIISYCFFIVVQLMDLIDTKTKKLQIGITMIVFALIITVKYVHSTLDLQDSKSVSTIFIYQLVFYMFIGSYTGIEYTTMDFISDAIFYIMISVIIINTLHIILLWPIGTVKSIIIGFLDIFTRRTLSFILSFNTCTLSIIGLMEIVQSLKSEWFMVQHSWCTLSKTSRVPLLELITKTGEDNILIQVQLILALFPIISSCYIVMYIVFDRVFVKFRKGRFWTSFFFFGLNLPSLLVISSFEIILDNLNDLGVVKSSADFSQMDLFINGLALILLAFILEMFSAILAPAGINKSFPVIINPNFQPAQSSGNNKVQKMTLKNIQKETMALRRKELIKRIPSLLPKCIILLALLVICIYNGSNASNNSWAVVNPNKFTPYQSWSTLNLDSEQISSPQCGLSAPNLESMTESITSFTTALNKFNSKVTKVDAVPGSAKSKFVAGVYTSYSVVLLCYCISFAREDLVYRPVVLLSIIPFSVVPLFALIYVPFVLKENVLSLLGELSIEAGMYSVVYLYFGFLIGVLALMIEEFMPLTSLFIEEDEIKNEFYLICL